MRFNQLSIRIILGVILFVANCFIWFSILGQSKNDDKLIVAYLNVGQGDAIFIEAPNGNQMVIDGGCNRKILSELGKMMSFFDRSIDVVVSTHPDKDHIGGLFSVLDRFHVQNVVLSGIFEGNSYSRAFHGRIQKESSVLANARRGMIVDLGEGVVFQILFPDRDVAL